MAGARTQSFAVALYDFTARDAKELSIIAGDELTILLSKPGRQWLQVLNLRNKHDGWVPSNYIRETNTINVAEFEKLDTQWLQVLNLKNKHDGWVPSNYIRETNTINVAEYGADFLLNAYDEKVQEIKESIDTNSRKGEVGSRSKTNIFKEIISNGNEPSLSNQTKPSNESLVECNTTYWSHSQLGDVEKSDVMTTVLLSHSQKEYDDVERLITSAEIANSTVFSINRIQNPSNWLPLRKKMVELLQKYGSVEKINMQTLFHGTNSDNISNICKDNFNWRLAGTNVGHLYGKGAYFSNSAKYSHDYSTSDPNGHRFMIVTGVIVGSITKGDKDMTKPPLDPSTGMLYDTSVDNVNNPKIFVKYDETEYYPIYVIEYTTNSTPSNITVKSSDSPSHEWFFCDDSAEWERYENSDDIEKSYNNNKLLPYKFMRSNYEYELDFLKMIQKNYNTSKEREVKRKQKVIIVSASEPKVLLESESVPYIPKINKKKCCVIQ